MLNRINQIKPRLIVTNKQSLKELESAGLRTPALDKFSVTLPSELGDGHNSGQYQPNPQIVAQLGKKFPNLPSDDILNATLLVQGHFGDNARMVGLPPELAQEAEWMMLDRNKEQGMSSRALTTDDLTREMLTKKPERDLALQAIQNERNTGKPKKNLNSLKKKLTNQGVERHWDQERSEQRRHNVEMRDEPELTDRDKRVREMNQMTDYYDKLMRIAQDPNHPHKDDALTTIARDRYDGAMQREKDEVARQMKFLKDNQIDPNSISTMKPEQLRDPNGIIRKFGIDEDILARSQRMDEYNHPDSDMGTKKDIEKQIVQFRHQTGAGDKRGDSMNHKLVEYGMKEQVLQRMMQLNEERYPQKQVMKNRRNAMMIK